jgi:hypothetical protein
MTEKPDDLGTIAAGIEAYSYPAPRKRTQVHAVIKFTRHVPKLGDAYRVQALYEFLDDATQDAAQRNHDSGPKGPSYIAVTWEVT